MTDHTITLTINGIERSVEIDVRSTLLDLLRERLQLTGTKKGCDHGLCGACTVTVDGERVLSCLTLAVSIDGSSVLTIEGIAEDDRLHPLQQAFLDCDGFQCGYCTSGQISSAHALLYEHARGDLSAASFEPAGGNVVGGPDILSDNEIRERMAGNICRCGAYPNIVDAVASCLRDGRP
ncbi:(2Fe-2S)-binding protein [Mycobacteroides franklinii]|uniref:(2Fe-2S)-binding protein n=2 Tax=Mycobacteriaceae TaxID=1762 RepID=A0A4R8QYQ7_9MYCO|nr:(2Fe-2S)-binding protein [Mycobacteroides franklinii]ORA64528.1 (2Fe-2S)-binding protein [Mycobacteroides franklinii]TDH22749.1 (2Fe-2S)-binding protein [Mycobacteroides franklinii]TDZ44421.1 Caffeine dehydrogenase subunit gamma [Mycobacteroides franklinii]TDZ47308.1 Caffeine dehydrogenase subunit gamma [Mycobacteroides franklinii]TDZ57974.1 Caffeine dehydrogenase subunit gamma [Mycobacteroides franklinii]